MKKKRRLTTEEETEMSQDDLDLARASFSMEPGSLQIGEDDTGFVSSSFPLTCQTRPSSLKQRGRIV